MPGEYGTVPIDVVCSPGVCDGVVVILGDTALLPPNWHISGGGACTGGTGIGTGQLVIVIPGDAVPGPQSLPVFVRKGSDLCPDTAVVVTVDECVDLSFAGVSDQEEASVGGFLCVNDDDDDLRPLTVSVSGGWKGTCDRARLVSVTCMYPLGRNGVEQSR